MVIKPDGANKRVLVCAGPSLQTATGMSCLPPTKFALQRDNVLLAQSDSWFCSVSSRTADRSKMALDANRALRFPAKVREFRRNA